MKITDIFAETNRGMLLDVVVFLLNLTLISVLTSHFSALVQAAEAEDPVAKFGLFLMCLAMLVLPAAGAVLKRWHFHQRRSAQQNLGSSKQDQSSESPELFDPLSLQTNPVRGCLFHPIFYFTFSLVLASAVGVFVSQMLFGKRGADNPILFVPMVILTLVASVFLTVLVYRYFFPPKNPPQDEFLLSPQSEQLGDLCIFVNMILFQVVWNMVAAEFPTGGDLSISNRLGGFFFLTIIALLVYFPPRIFYLAEDSNRPVTWFTMLLANSPLIVRVLF